MRIKQWKWIGLLTSMERRYFIVALLISAVTGILQVVSVGSIIPFVALLIKPELVHQSEHLLFVFEFVAVANERTFLLIIGFCVLALLIVSNISLAVTAWYTAWLGWNVQSRLSTSLLRSSLEQPYIAFINRNSAYIVKNIVVESAQYAQGVIVPVVRIFSSSVTILLLVGFLLLISPNVTILAILIFGIAYAVIYLLVRNPLKRIGEHLLRANARRFKTAHEALGSIKEVKILGCEPYFLGLFEPAAQIYSRIMVMQAVLGLLPRYIIEILAFGLAFLILLFLMYQDGAAQPLLAVASGFIMAGYRLLPAFQQVYSSVSTLRFNLPVVNNLQKDFSNDKSCNAQLAINSVRLPLRQAVRLENITYFYPDTSSPALTDINLALTRQGLFAFVGTTGAGKSTLADIILGLLSPQEGRITVDGVEIDEGNLRAWQNNLGYVPQAIYLLDCTILANIAFGVPAHKVDRNAVERAAHIANIHDFITESLPMGYDTVVGERGVKLSGGQRQRIGIARALYHDPEVLVLDEATSALDSATEALVHQAILQAAKVKTVVVIAHRMSTVRDCDRIFVLKNGRIAVSGTYEELLSDSDEFRRLTSGTTAALQ